MTQTGTSIWQRKAHKGHRYEYRQHFLISSLVPRVNFSARHIPETYQWVFVFHNRLKKIVKALLLNHSWYPYSKPTSSPIFTPWSAKYCYPLQGMNPFPVYLILESLACGTGAKVVMVSSICNRNYRQRLKSLFLTPILFMIPGLLIKSCWSSANSSSH